MKFVAIRDVTWTRKYAFPACFRDDDSQKITLGDADDSEEGKKA